MLRRAAQGHERIVSKRSMQRARALGVRCRHRTGSEILEPALVGELNR